MDRSLLEDEDTKTQYPPLRHYLPFFSLLNVSALGFGTTIAFTGATLADVTKDMDLCGASYDDSDVPCRMASLLASIIFLAALVG